MRYCHKYYKNYPETDWLTYTGEVPVKEGDVIDGKTVIHVEDKNQPGCTITKKYYRVKTDDLTATEPTDKENRTKNISGIVDEKFIGSPVTVWVYKYGQASDYTTEFIATTTVGETNVPVEEPTAEAGETTATVVKKGQINIENAVLREALDADVGDYKVCTLIDGQERAINLGVIEAPKNTCTVRFYDCNGDEIESSRHSYHRKNISWNRSSGKTYGRRYCC